MFRFSQFSRNVHFPSQDPFWDATFHFVVHVSLISSRYHISSVFSHFWWLRQFWGLLVRYFVEMPLSWSLCGFPHHYTKIMWFWKEDHRGQVPFSSHYIMCTYYQCHLLVDLDHWAEVVCMRFLYDKVTFSLLFPLEHRIVHNIHAILLCPWNSRDDLSFNPNIGNLCLLFFSWLAWLWVYQF